MSSNNTSRNNDIDSVLDDILAENQVDIDNINNVISETHRSLESTTSTANHLLDLQDSAFVDDVRESARRNESRRRSRLLRRAMEQQRERRRTDSTSSLQDQSTTSTIFRRPAPSSAPVTGRQMPIPLSTSTIDHRHPQTSRNRDVRNRLSASRNMSALQNLQRVGQELESESRHLRALLNQPILSDPRNGEVQRDVEREVVEEMHSYHDRKRRKTQINTYEADPTQLVMEIESCDGGLYSGLHGDYTAVNVLKDDDSVYCTKGNRCNLVLRHAGGAPFSLKEIHIRAPCSGYTAPVQEGMIFISMDMDDIFRRTAQYQIQYSPIRRSTSTRPTLDLRYDPDDDTTQDLLPMAPERAYRLAEIPSDFESHTTQPFEVTTSCSDEDDNCYSAPDSRHPSRRVAPDRIGQLRFEETDSESDQEQDIDEVYRSREYNPVRFNRRITRIMRIAQITNDDSSSSNIGRSPALTDAIEAADDATQEAVKAVGGGLMVPHARFFIQSDMNRCTIRFDPPVSGRFVLLKMWSPQHRQGGNIDVQSVVVKGFAGMRTFPSITPM